MRSPLHDNHTDASYEEDNREMRAEHKKDTGKTLGKRLTSGTNSRRVSSVSYTHLTLPTILLV